MLGWAFLSTPALAQTNTPRAAVDLLSNVAAGQSVVLDGAGSSSPTGQAVTYSWQILTAPAGSAAALDSTTSARVRFTPDIAGDYDIQLIVTNAAGSSAPVIATISTTNQPPKASVRTTRRATDGSVLLDGSGSSDADGEALTYAWTLVSAPAGSTATIINPGAAQARLTPDINGTYSVSLIVTDARGRSSVSVASSFVRGSSAPVAAAGADRSAVIGSTLRLESFESTDLDGNTLTSTWSLLSKPSGSTAALSAPDLGRVSLTPDVAGDYVAQVAVSDGTDTSYDTIVVSADQAGSTTLNAAPVAKAGKDQKVTVGSVVALDATGSTDVDGSTLAYKWSLISRPAGSTATITNANAARTSFTADLAGDYVAQLVVTDGFGLATADTLVVTTASAQPIADAGLDKLANASRLASVDGTGSQSLQGASLSYKWSMLGLGPVGATQSVTIAASTAATTNVTLGSGTIPLHDAVFIAPTSLPFVGSDTGQGGSFLRLTSMGRRNNPSGVLHTIWRLRNSGTTSRNVNLVAVGNPYNQAFTLPPMTELFVASPFATGSATHKLMEGTVQRDVKAASSSTFTNNTQIPSGPATDFAVMQLAVTDTEGMSASTTLVTMGNVAPVARPGNEATGIRNQAVALDGSTSSDANGTALTYRWSLLHLPPGSASTLTNPTAAQASLTADRVGLYVAQLIVSDGQLDSAPATVVINIQNVRPVANAGANQSVFVGELAQLDGSGSIDDDSDPLTYQWQFSSTPAGSNATLISADTASPRFTPDRRGVYVVDLIVNDGFESSLVSQVTITAPNRAPTAEFGNGRTVTVGQAVQLNGSGSTDPDNDPLTYAWSFVSVPASSTAAFTDPTSQATGFTPDVAGDYVVQLIVNDGDLSSAADTATFIAEEAAQPNEPPVLSGIGNLTVVLGSTLRLNLQATDPNNDRLMFFATPLPLPQGMTLNGVTGAVTYTPTASQVGVRTVTFGVSDGLASDTETVQITVQQPGAGTVTSLSGRVLDANNYGGGTETPVVGATVTLVGTSVTTTTAADGTFTLSGFGGGAFVVSIDGGTAAAAPDGSGYGDFSANVSIIANANNVPPNPFVLPRAPLGTPINPNGETIVDNPTLGITLTIAQNSATSSGVPYTGNVSVTSVPPSGFVPNLPPTLAPCALISIQPFDVTFNPPALISLPNNEGLAPGSEVDIYAVGPQTGVFSIVGTGQVSLDGTRINTITGGIPSGSLIAVAPVAPTSGLSLDQNSSTFTPSELGEGNFRTSHQLPGYMSLGSLQTLTFVYNSTTADPRPVIATGATIPARGGIPSDLISQLEVGGVIVTDTVFTSTSEPNNPNDPGLSETNSETLQQSLQFDAEAFPTGAYPYKFMTFGKYACTNIAGVSTGLAIVRNEVQSPFGSGWTLADVDRLTEQEDGSIIIAEGDGKTLVFMPVPPAPVLTGTGGTQISATAPSTVRINQNEQNGRLLVFNERYNMPLGANVTVDIGRPGNNNGSSGALVGTTLVSGQRINSFFVHYDILGAPNNQLISTGTATFDSEIVGIITRDATLNATDGTFFAPNTLYPNHPTADNTVERGLEINLVGADSINLSNDLKTITLNIRTGTSADQVRVLTRSPGTLVASETFDTGANGWTAVNNISTGTWVATGGNPGGYFEASDDQTGVTMYFQPPAGWLDPSPDLYGGYVVYDVRQNLTTQQFANNELVIEGGGIRLVYNTVYNPGTAFTRYAIPLQAGTGWRVSTDTGPVPTEAQFRTVLENLTLFNIRGEYRNGADTDGLDNVAVYKPQEVLVATNFTSPDGDFSELVRNPDGSFTRTYKDGIKAEFAVTGEQTAEVDRNGNERNFVYDAQGRMTEVTDAFGAAQTLQYTNGKLTKIIAPDGSETTFEYDAAGNLSRVIHPDGSSRQYAYDGQHRMTSETNQVSNAVANAFSTTGHLAGMNMPDGSSVTMEVARTLGLPSLGEGTSTDPAAFVRPEDRVTTVTDGRGNVTITEVNEFGQPVKVTDPLGRIMIMERNADNLVTLMVRPTTGLDTGTNTVLSSVTAEMTYDSLGNLLTSTEAVGTTLQRTTTFEYNQFGQVTKITDPANFEKTYVYDGNGNLLQEFDALNQVSEYTYNNRGLQITAKNRRNAVITGTYNAEGNLSTWTDPNGTVTRLTYDGRGNVLTRIRAQGLAEQRTTSWTYDPLNRVLTETDGEGGTTSYVYDLYGNLLSLTDPTGVIQTRVYDTMNRVTTINDPATGQEIMTYDANGNRLTHKDAKNTITSYTYDAANRMTKVTDGLGQERLVALDVQDNVTIVTDARGNATTMTYDILKRAVRRTNPIGRQWTFGYDIRDNRTSSLDPKGQTITFTYDALERLTNVATPDNAHVYAYDPEANMTGATDNDTALAFGFDALNRLSTASTLAAGIQPVTTLTYAYNARNNLLSITDSDGGITRHTWDKADRLTRLETPAGDFIDIAYDPSGRMTGMNFPNGVTSTASYDTGGRVESIGHANTSGEIAGYDHSYDPVGSLTQIAEVGQTKTYTYDALNRLRTGGTAGAPETYTYDAEGNRTTSHLSTTHVVDAANQLLEDDTHTYVYDLNGNLVSKTEKATNAVTAYGYNAEDQLIQITKPDASVITYKYDAFGRRVQKDVAGVVVRYVYDGDDIRLEYSTSTSPLARYSYGDGVDEPLSAERGGARYFYHANHLGSIRHLTDASGAVVNSYDYDAFGKPTSAVASVPQPFGFTGREADPESGLMHYRARAYDPSTGRFLQEDPIGFGGGDLNVYAYVFNDPQGWVDPYGLSATEYGAAAGSRTAGTAAKLYGVATAASCTFGIIASSLRLAREGFTVTNVISSASDWLACGAVGLRVLKNPCASQALNFAVGGMAGVFSFTPGTEVKTAQGDRPIETLKVGDEVLARDERTGETHTRKVTALHKRVAAAVLWLTLAIPAEASPNLHLTSLAEPSFRIEELGTTPEHPLFVEGKGWTLAGDLVVGDRIVALDGPSLELMALRLDERPATVYNLTVASDSSFFVGKLGAWGHNVNGNSLNDPRWRWLYIRLTKDWKWGKTVDLLRRASEHGACLLPVVKLPHRWTHAIEKFLYRRVPGPGNRELGSGLDKPWFWPWGRH